MDQIVVPQFLEVEDRIIGPITMRQFVIMIVALILTFLFYRLFDFSLFAVLAIITISVAAIFSFGKVRGQPFHEFIVTFIMTLRSPKIKIWNKDYDRQIITITETKKVEKPIISSRPRITPSNLSEISLIVDTGGVYRGDNFNNENSK